MTKLTTLFYKVLNGFASICLAFNVDWDKEYEDDDYVVALKEGARR